MFLNDSGYPHDGRADKNPYRTTVVLIASAFLNRDFALAREIIQNSLTLDSGKFVNFIQKFGYLVSFSYNMVMVSGLQIRCVSAYFTLI